MDILDDLSIRIVLSWWDRTRGDGDVLGLGMRRTCETSQSCRVKGSQIWDLGWGRCGIEVAWIGMDLKTQSELETERTWSAKVIGDTESDPVLMRRSTKPYPFRKTRWRTPPLQLDLTNRSTEAQAEMK